MRSFLDGLITLSEKQWFLHAPKDVGPYRAIMDALQSHLFETISGKAIGNSKDIKRYGLQKIYEWTLNEIDLIAGTQLASSITGATTLEISDSKMTVIIDQGALPKTDWESVAHLMRRSGTLNCLACGDGGWEAYGIGRNDPHFRECAECANPKGHPSP